MYIHLAGGEMTSANMHTSPRPDPPGRDLAQNQQFFLKGEKRFGREVWEEENARWDSSARECTTQHATCDDDAELDIYIAV